MRLLPSIRWQFPLIYQLLTQLGQFGNRLNLLGVLDTQRKERPIPDPFPDSLPDSQGLSENRFWQALLATV